jgi:ribulose-phosphate 3-epimerase
MVEIIPAILPKSFEELQSELVRLKGVSKLMQIDLVHSNVLSGQESLPLWQDFDFECDVMLPNPALEVEVCLNVGAARVVVHAQAPSAQEALDFLQPYRIGDYPILVGIALASHDTPDVLKNFEHLYDYVQVMGIDNIGKQGEPADPHHKDIELIKNLRALYPHLTIQVDGAVAPRVKELAQAGANRLVVGSAIVRAEDPRAVFKALYTEANG